VSLSVYSSLEDCASCTHNSASPPAPATLPRTYERACELRDAAAAAHRHSDYQKAVVLYNEAVAYIADAKPLFGAPPSLAHTLLQSVRFGLVVAAEAVCTEVIVGGSSNSAAELQEVKKQECKALILELAVLFLSVGRVVVALSQS
jgi:hypothetical protein